MSNPKHQSQHLRRNISLVTATLMFLSIVQQPLWAGAPTHHQPLFKSKLEQIRQRGRKRTYPSSKAKASAGSQDIFTSKYSLDGILLWTRQLGTSGDDFSSGVVTDSNGNIFITGGAGASLGGSGSVGAFLAKYSPDGTLLWTRQLGALGDYADSYANDIAIDSSGNLLITGTVSATVTTPNKANYDAFVAKYNSSGTLLWAQKLGSPTDEESLSIATDSSGNAVISGYTLGKLGARKWGPKYIEDAFVAKYNPTGALLWVQQIGTPDYDQATGVTTDSKGNVFIAGYTGGGLANGNAASEGYLDVFVAGYSPKGKLQWKQQLGSAQTERALGVTTDGSDNLFISGHTFGTLGGGPNKGLDDAFVAKLNKDGGVAWLRQLGTSSSEYSTDIGTSSNGSVFITGFTDGNLGSPSKGLFDAWVAGYSPDGTLSWKQQLGTNAVDVSFGIAADGNNAVVITGYTDGSF